MKIGVNEFFETKSALHRGILLPGVGGLLQNYGKKYSPESDTSHDHRNSSSPKSDEFLESGTLRKRLTPDNEHESVHRKLQATSNDCGTSEQICEVRYQEKTESCDAGNEHPQRVFHD